MKLRIVLLLANPIVKMEGQQFLLFCFVLAVLGIEAWRQWVTYPSLFILFYFTFETSLTKLCSLILNLWLLPQSSRVVESAGGYHHAGFLWCFCSPRQWPVPNASVSSSFFYKWKLEVPVCHAVPGCPPCSNTQQWCSSVFCCPAFTSCTSLKYRGLLRLGAFSFPLQTVSC